MSYSSIDKIQKVLAQSVFQHTLDKKKAAGRALGTIVEIITYYLIRQWNLSSDVTEKLRYKASPFMEKREKKFILVNPILSQKIRRGNIKSVGFGVI